MLYYINISEVWNNLQDRVYINWYAKWNNYRTKEKLFDKSSNWNVAGDSNFISSKRKKNSYPAGLKPSWLRLDFMYFCLIQCYQVIAIVIAYCGHKNTHNWWLKLYSFKKEKQLSSLAPFKPLPKKKKKKEKF